MTILRSRQSGITLLGFIIVLAVVGFFAFLFMKLYPAYYEYYNVVSAMEAIKRAIDTIAKFSGKAPRSWESPGLTETSETLDLL